MQTHHSLFKLFKLRPWIDLDLFYAKVRFGQLCFWMGKNEIILFSLKTIAAYDLKVGRCIELNDLMKLHEYQRSRLSFDLPQIHWVFKLKSPPSPQTVETKYHVKDFGITEMKIYINGLGHMTKMVAMPIYGKKVFKKPFLQNQWADYNET